MWNKIKNTIKGWFTKPTSEDDRARKIVEHEFATTPQQYKNDKEWTKRNAMVYLQREFPSKTKEECEKLFNKWVS